MELLCVLGFSKIPERTVRFCGFGFGTNNAKFVCVDEYCVFDPVVVCSVILNIRMDFYLSSISSVLKLKNELM